MAGRTSIVGGYSKPNRDFLHCNGDKLILFLINCNQILRYDLPTLQTLTT